MSAWYGLGDASTRAKIYVKKQRFEPLNAVRISWNHHVIRNLSLHWISCRSGSDFRQWSLSVMARTVVPSSYLISDWVMDNAR